MPKNCTHSYATSSKECCICRIKRAVEVTHHAASSRINGYNSQISLPALGEKQLYSSPLKSHQDISRKGLKPVETNYSRWLQSLQQKRTKTSPHKKLARPKINWNLFQLEQHRPKFDHWETKLLKKIVQSGKADLLLFQMCSQ